MFYTRCNKTKVSIMKSTLHQYIYKVYRSYVCRLAPRMCNCSYKQTYSIETPDLLMYLDLALVQCKV